MIEITERDFDPNRIIQSLRSGGVGGIVSFIGCVRDFSEIENDRGEIEKVPVSRLEYESYSDMAAEKMSEIREHALAAFDIQDMHLIHRVGVLKASDQIVMIAVSAAHRKDAFRACQYAIDELKRGVPIWKKEFTSRGDYWVGTEEGG